MKPPVLIFALVSAVVAEAPDETRTAEIQWLCSVLYQAAELDFVCTDGLSALSCSPLFHDILGLPRPIPPVADVRDARDQILEGLYNRMDEEEARGGYWGGGAMSNFQQRLLIVKAAASVLLERASAENPDSFMNSLWHAYKKEFLSGLPGGMIMRMLRRGLDILFVHVARLPAPMSSRRIVEQVCGRQHHEEL